MIRLLGHSIGPRFGLHLNGLNPTLDATYFFEGFLNPYEGVVSRTSMNCTSSSKNKTE